MKKLNLNQFKTMKFTRQKRNKNEKSEDVAGSHFTFIHSRSFGESWRELKMWMRGWNLDGWDGFAFIQTSSDFHSFASHSTMTDFNVRLYKCWKHFLWIRSLLCGAMAKSQWEKMNGFPCFNIVFLFRSELEWESHFTFHVKFFKDVRAISWLHGCNPSELFWHRKSSKSE